LPIKEGRYGADASRKGQGCWHAHRAEEEGTREGHGRRGVGVPAALERVERSRPGAVHDDVDHRAEHQALPTATIGRRQ
jgi:hypothetical protein